MIITKLQDTGGAVTTATCKEQLLYEIHDPAAYFTPDTVADFSQVRIDLLDRDRVQVDGALGKPRPDALKVSLAVRDGFIGEGQISYAGTGAVDRARLAADVVVGRLGHARIQTSELRCNLIGVDALHGSRLAVTSSWQPYEVRLRVAARTQSRVDAEAVANEIETLYTNGPAGGGGVTKSAREVLSIVSTYIPRDLVRCVVRMETT